MEIAFVFEQNFWQTVLIPFLIFFTVAVSAPGPSNFMVLVSGVNYGFRRTIPHMLGITFGFPLLWLALGLGLGTIIELYPIIHIIIKYFGIAYFLYLAWKIANAAPPQSNNNTSRPFTFLEGAIFQWMNPKALAMAFNMIAVYISTSYDFNSQLYVFVSIAIVLTFIDVCIWTLFGVKMQKVLQDAKINRAFNISMAIILILSLALTLYA